MKRFSHSTESICSMQVCLQPFAVLTEKKNRRKSEDSLDEQEEKEKATPR
jgi:hypothetical protein